MWDCKGEIQQGKPKLIENRGCVLKTAKFFVGQAGPDKAFTGKVLISTTNCFFFFLLKEKNWQRFPTDSPAKEI